MSFLENLIGGNNEEEKEALDQETQEETTDESSDENFDEEEKSEKKEKPASDIEDLRNQVVNAYLARLNKKDFVKGLLRGKGIKSAAREYILAPQQAEEDIDFSGLNLPPEIAQFATALKGGGSSLVPSLLQKFTGVSVGYDEVKELNPMRELMAKTEYQTDAKALEELKKSIKSGTDVTVLLAAPILVGTSVVVGSTVNAQTTSESGIEQSHHVMPIENTNGVKITSKFGQRNHPVTGEKDNHTGIDLSANEGTSISSICDGEVLENRKTDLGGNELVIKGNDGKTYYYLHMQKKSELAEGNKVKSGDEIGYVGETGRSTGPHLHLTIKENDKPIDPLAALPDVFDGYKMVA